MNCARRMTFLLLAVCCGWTTAAWTVEPDPVVVRPHPQQAQFAAVARKIQKKLSERGDKECAFGNITPKTGNSEFGKRFIREVEAQLRLLQVAVVPQAAITISGKFQIEVTDSSRPKVVFLIELTRDKAFQPESTLDVTIDFSDVPNKPVNAGAPAPPVPVDRTDREAEEALFAAGVTTSCSPNATLLKRREQIQQLINMPQDRTELIKLSYRDPAGNQVHEPVVRVKDGMGYAVQIRAVRDAIPNSKNSTPLNQPLTHSIIESPLNERPLGFVPLTLDTTYIIRLINPLKTEAVARVEIDNVSTFRYYSLTPAPSLFIVPAEGSIDIPGWVITLEASRKFLITTFDDSARAKENLDPPVDGMGLISVAFRHSWEQYPPADEGSALSGVQGASGKPDLTGLGAPIARKYESVPRHVGFQSDVIHLRYGKTVESQKQARRALVSAIEPTTKP